MGVAYTKEIPDHPDLMSWTRYPHGTEPANRRRGSPPRSYEQLPDFEIQLPEIHVDRENHWNIEVPEETWKLIRYWLDELEKNKDE